jgi:DNA-binding response OmpR family regulator
MTRTDPPDDEEISAASPSAGSLTIGPAPTPRPVRGRIVLIEDNPADVTLFRWALWEHGIDAEIEEYSHGDVAMAFAQHQGGFRQDAPPDVVVVDLALPGHDGMQVLGALCKNPIFCRTEVGVFTSSTDPRDRARAMELGADFYIVKPMDLEGLKALAELIGEQLPVTLPRRLRRHSTTPTDTPT